MKILKKLTSSLVAMLLLFSATFSYAHYEITGTRELPDDEITQTTFENFEYSSDGGVFYVSSGANLTFKDAVTFNANEAQYGGAIYNKGTITFGNGATFTNNKAEQINDKREYVVTYDASASASAYGGGIYNNYGTMTFSGVTTISSNTANAISYGGTATSEGSASASAYAHAYAYARAYAYGGGIYNDNGTITFSNVTTISSNTANAISYGCTATSEGSANADADVFAYAYASAYAYGGGIYNNGDITFNGETTISSNTANAISYGGTATSEGSANADADAYAYGGGVYNDSNATMKFNNSTIFSDNSAVLISEGGKEDSYEMLNWERTVYAKGGAIYNKGNIEFELNTSFNSNRVNSYQKGGTVTGESGYGSGYAYAYSEGGAIYNDKTITFKDIAIFDNNSVTASAIGGTVNGVQSYANAHACGGAIYNKGVATFEDGAIFRNNSATQGGAIYNRGTINLTANTNNVEFTGNKANDLSNAIHNDNGTINLYAVKDTSKIIFNDSISGNGTIKINYIENYRTGTIELNANMDAFNGYVFVSSGYGSKSKIKVGENGTFFNNASSVCIGDGDGYDYDYHALVTIDTQNGKIDNSKLSNLSIENSSNLYLAIDINAQSNTADKYTITGSNTGIITISDINLIGDLKDFNVQILKGGNFNLALTDELKNRYHSSTREQRTEEITPTVAWDKVFHVQERGVETNLKVVNNNTLQLATEGSGQWIDKESLGDTLHLVNTLETNQEKNFNFDSADDVYTATINLGETKGTLNINGVVDEEGKVSTIDLNGYSGFGVNNSNTLSISSTEIRNGSNYKGGAIYNGKGLLEIGSNMKFNCNEAEDGGAIYNDEIINIGDNVIFTRNMSGEEGGAIYNDGLLEIGSNIEFNFNKSDLLGGAIYNEREFIINDNVVFRLNRALGSGGAIYNSFESIIKIGNNTIFEENDAIYGGAIINICESEMEIGNNAIFRSNTAMSGGAILNYVFGNAIIGSNAIFEYNVATSSGGAIHNGGIEELQELQEMQIMGSDLNIGENVIFRENEAEKGGAIYNIGISSVTMIVDKERLEEIKESEEVKIVDCIKKDDIYKVTICSITERAVTIENGAKFIGNKATGKGGAIYNKGGVINLTANTNDVEFTGNTANGKSNAIYDEGGIINLYALNEGKIIFNDAIESKDATSTININKEGNIVNKVKGVSEQEYGTIILNADMNGYKGAINIEEGTIKIDKEGTWFNKAETVNVARATIDMINDKVQVQNFNNLKVGNTLYLTVDVDLEKAVMDTIEAKKFTKRTREQAIEIKDFNIIKEATEYETTVTFTNTEKLFKEIFTEVEEIETDEDLYTVKYNEDGTFTFARSGLKPAPALEGDLVKVGGYIMQSNVINQAFTTMEQLKETCEKGSMYIEEGMWIRPFGMQETVRSSGMDIETKSYGTLAGIDVSKGDNGVCSIYAGVTGSKEEVKDLTVDQIGYVIGASATRVEDNWYVGVTANIGTNSSTIKDNKGSDEYNTYMYTIGLKAAYEIELDEMWSIEPGITAWYGSTNGKSYYSNRKGERVGVDSWNNVEIKPVVRVKAELNNGWLPYATIGYAINLGDKASDTDRQIDEMGENGYVEYGLGVHKDFKGSSWSAYVQATGRNGSRNGYGGNLGIKYKFAEPIKKAKKQEIKAKEIESIKGVVEETKSKDNKVETRLSIKPRFEQSRTVLTEESKAKLAEIAKIANENKELKLVIEGYADKQEHKNNKQLSKQRARKIAKVLKTEYGVTNKIKFVGKGAKNLVSTGDSEQEQAQNRRIEVVIK